MGHIYRLSINGIVNPFFLRNPAKQAIATSSRILGTGDKRQPEMILHHEEPDLLVGEKFDVWMGADGFFRAEISKERKVRLDAEEEKRRELRQGEKDADEAFYHEHVEGAKELCASRADADVLKGFLDEQKRLGEAAYGIYRGLWYKSGEDKSRSNIAWCELTRIAQARDMIAMHIQERLLAKGVKGHVVAAIHPREGARDGVYAPGHDHFVLDVGVRAGRIRREPGQLLCRSKRKLWSGTDGGCSGATSCPQCLSGMIKILKVLENEKP